ncbi:MAG: prevent-host-death protein [Rhizobium sp.]|nr:prevent-host-death protein [Rhizobium sp.]
MKVSVTEAKAQLTELVRRAESGEEIVLTRHGQEVIRFQPVARKKATTPEEKRALFKKIREMARANMTPGESAARSQDFLYDEFGIPK